MFAVSNLTESAGTDIIAVCPPRDTDIPVLLGFTATAGSIDQKLFVCSAVGVVENKYMIQSGSTSANLVAGNASSFSVGDIFVATNRNGGHEALEVATVSGNEVTWVTGPSVPIATRSLLYSFYRASDSGYVKFPEVEPNLTTKHYAIPANTTVTLRVHDQAGRDVQVDGVDDSFNSEGCPMAIIMTNNTDAGSIDRAEFDWIGRDASTSRRDGVDATSFKEFEPIVIPKPIPK